jgi:hypothetical protein
MKTFLVALALTGFAAGAFAGSHHGDVLLMQQVHKERGMNLPQRGLTMAQVEHRYGAPLQKLDTRGGDTPRHPPINRWVYAGYTVYFERNRVIHAVINPPPGNS